MVLEPTHRIFNNTVEKARCISKEDTRDILFRLKHQSEHMFRERPRTEHVENGIYIGRSSRDTTPIIKPIRTKYGEQSYEASKRAYNTAMFDLDTKYGHR